MKSSFAALLALGLAVAAGAAAQSANVGAATCLSAPRAGDQPPPRAPYRSPEMARRAAPTNQWYSALIFDPKPQALYAQPLSVRATPQGLEMALPSKEVVPTERHDVVIRYPHRDPVVISPVAFAPGPARLAQAGDWSIEISMARGADDLRASVAHGSPFVDFEVSRGDLRLHLPQAGVRLGGGADDSPVLALQAGAKAYAFFGPHGGSWQALSPTVWQLHLPAGKGYLAAAALPDSEPATLALFTAHAYAFIQDTRVAWAYDAATSSVQTTFSATTRTMEGPEETPLLGLYPHQWSGNAALAARLGPGYDTVRGRIRLLAASSFQTRLNYHGFVPYWPGVKGTPRDDDLRDVMKIDLRNSRRMVLESDYGRSAYWQGKGLQRITQLMSVAEQQGDLAMRGHLLALAEDRIQAWFSGQDSKSYFVCDKALGTVVSYPEEFFSVSQMNDHHFAYGYWIHAMADIALRDPGFAAPGKWGAMTDLLVADIATAERGRSDYPFLRNFDPYEGHSWASGVGLGDFGNNQESSSEAVNAWAGLVLWGEETGNRALRDLGLYLYTTEIASVQTYVFDLQRQVLAPEYKNVEVSQLFGAQYAHNTWWIDEPRQIHGINLLPITTASTYLGRDPAYVRRNLAALAAETAAYESRGRRAKPADIWQDLFAEYLALADPAAGLAQWDRWGSFELGDTRSHALHWLLSLQRMGTPDFEVRADTTLYSVFKTADGHRTYLAYNAGVAPITVHFSDGKALDVAPHSLAQAH
ncbi:MAG: hypothetical protein KGL43_23350 [Burkholderiales bacterium]|nr:hypothetical protein [Burkholderiales bacterium]MDE2456533.1 hypothetical protein [Burkholderiales bacterium]